MAGRRLTVRASMTEVIVFCDGSEAARHPRSWARADVRLLPAHARELRLARDAAKALSAGDVTVDVAQLSDYDELTGLAG